MPIITFTWLLSFWNSIILTDTRELPVLRQHPLLQKHPVQSFSRMLVAPFLYLISALANTPLAIPRSTVKRRGLQAHITNPFEHGLLPGSLDPFLNSLPRQFEHFHLIYCWVIPCVSFEEQHLQCSKIIPGSHAVGHR